MKNFFYAISSVIIIFTLASCKSKKIDDELVEPADDLYNRGLTHLEQNKPALAAKEFNQVFLQHPGDNLTPRAELMQAYSLFVANEYEETIDVLEIFIKLHPMNVDVAYAYYLKALSSYMQISTASLDQSVTVEAQKGFEEVIKRFPNSKYAIDASLKIDLVNDHLAGHEMNIGRYYLKLNNPLAAIPRFQTVIKNYQTTSHTPEALYRLVVSFKMLGLDESAKIYAAVLGHNYPQTQWYKYAYFKD